MAHLNQSESLGLTSANMLTRIHYVVEIALDQGDPINLLKQFGLIFYHNNISYNQKILPEILCVPLSLFERRINQFSKIFPLDDPKETSQTREVIDLIDESSVKHWYYFSYPNTFDANQLHNFIEKEKVSITELHPTQQKKNTGNTVSFPQTQRPMIFEWKKSKLFEKLDLPSRIPEKTDPKISIIHSKMHVFAVKTGDVSICEFPSSTIQRLPSIAFELSPSHFSQEKK